LLHSHHHHHHHLRLLQYTKQWPQYPSGLSFAPWEKKICVCIHTPSHSFSVVFEPCKHFSRRIREYANFHITRWFISSNEIFSVIRWSLIAVNFNQ
jgi:hypothetical protein